MTQSESPRLQGNRLQYLEEPNEELNEIVCAYTHELFHSLVVPEIDENFNLLRSTNYPSYSKTDN